MFKRYKTKILIGLAVLLLLALSFSLYMIFTNSNKQTVEDLTQDSTADQFAALELSLQDETKQQIDNGSFEFDSTNASALFNEIYILINNRDSEAAEDLIARIPDDSLEIFILEKNSLKLNLYIAMQDSDSYLEQRAEYLDLLKGLDSDEAEQVLNSFDTLYPEELPELTDPVEDEDEV